MHHTHTNTKQIPASASCSLADYRGRAPGKKEEERRGKAARIVNDKKAGGEGASEAW